MAARLGQPYNSVTQLRDDLLIGAVMIVLGVILLILGFVLGIPVLWTLGIIALVVGLVLVLLGATGHAVAGRKHYF